MTKKENDVTEKSNDGECIETIKQKCVEAINVGKRTSLEEQKTKISLEAVNRFYKIKIDGCVFTSKEEGEQKCDYLIYTVNGETHFFELKGSVVAEAFDQLLSTVEMLEQDEKLKCLIMNRDRVDAYIISPNRITPPSNIDSKKRKLARKLGTLCKDKPSDLLELVKLVKKVPSGKPSESNYTITLPAKEALQV